MDLSLNEQQLAIRDMAAEFAAKELTPYALEWDQQKHFPIETLRRAGALGMAGIYVREDVGGSGLSRLDGVVIFEALAAACPATAAYLSIHNMCAAMIDANGTDEQRRRWLPDLTSMRLLASYCLTEANAGSDAAALQTKAVRDGDTYVLNGTKQFISGAGASDVYVVMARTGGPGPRGISAFVVLKGTPGLSFGAEERKMGWHAQPTCAVVLEDVRVPAANRLGAEGDGFRMAMSALDGGRLNISACSLGGARSAFEKTTAYMTERRAFGQRLADLQALRFRLADMATDLEIARAFLWRAATALDRKSAQATTLSAMAKSFVTEAGFRVANEALQLHGGYGYLADYGVEKIVRDLRVHQILEGTSEVMRLIVARSLLSSDPPVSYPIAV